MCGGVHYEQAVTESRAQYARVGRYTTRRGEGGEGRERGRGREVGSGRSLNHCHPPCHVAKFRDLMMKGMYGTAL